MRYKELNTRFSAFKCSVSGLLDCFVLEKAFKYEFYILILLSPVAFLVGNSFLQSVALVLVMVMVMVVELLNSAIESVVDRIGEDYHELSRRAKDFGSASVFLTILIAVIFWASVLFTNFKY